MHKLDQKALKLSKHIICDTNAHGDYFSNEFGISRSAFQTLYLEADATIYHPITSVRPKYLQDKYVVLYFGSMDGLKAQSVAILSYIDPVSALLFSALLLKEPLDAVGIIGAIMIIGSAVIIETQIGPQ